MKPENALGGLVHPLFYSAPAVLQGGALSDVRACRRLLGPIGEDVIGCTRVREVRQREEREAKALLKCARCHKFAY